MVEGPNETRSWVQMDVPAPEFTLPSKSPAVAAPTLDAADAAGADEPDVQDEMEGPGGGRAARRDRGSQQAPDEAGGTGPRSSRPRRKKR